MRIIYDYFLKYLPTYFKKIICIFYKGHSGIISRNNLSHIAELDLTDNLLSDWSEIVTLLKMFPGLEFLNLSNNLLTPSSEFLLSVSSKMSHGLRKLGM